MMLCVQLDMKEEFDRIWKWAKTYMYMEEGENEGYFAWSCQTDGTKNSYGPAPDGEEYFAMALFFASHRWGDGEGIFAYEKEAKELLRACIHKGENGRPGEPMWNLSLIHIFQENDEKGKSVGLKNVYRRLSLYYGDRMTFDIESVVGKGTICRICIPL